MDELAERIKASIENRNGDPWFPELTADITEREWDCLHRDIDLTPRSYGTERVLSRTISAPREAITRLRACPSTGTEDQFISIEALTQEYTTEYQRNGVNFYSPDEILHTTVLSCIEDALAMTNQVPSLMRTVAALVRCLHVIKPEDGDHDVSFSEPKIPFSIFVSVPQERVANDALRVAEAIVHEAMHLQLTLFEKVISLVGRQTNKYYSPWRMEYRDARGILHAQYVFGVIDRFLAGLAQTRSAQDAEAKHVDGRRCEISEQMLEIQSFPYYADLTTIGACLAKRLAQVCCEHRQSHRSRRPESGS